MGPPITYMVDGKQYVTLTGGRGVVVAPPAAAGAGAALELEPKPLLAPGGAGPRQDAAAPRHPSPPVAAENSDVRARRRREVKAAPQNPNMDRCEWGLEPQNIR